MITKYAQAQLDEYIGYIAIKLQNIEAARAVRDDAGDTKNRLSQVAGILRDTDEFPSYKKIRFLRHRYVMIYRIEGDKVFVDYIFHELQDYGNKIG